MYLTIDGITACESPYARKVFRSTLLANDNDKLVEYCEVAGMCGFATTEAAVAAKDWYERHFDEFGPALIEVAEGGCPVYGSFLQDQYDSLGGEEENS